jgi:hypothetical protein
MVYCEIRVGSGSIPGIKPPKKADGVLSLYEARLAAVSYPNSLAIGLRRAVYPRDFSRINPMDEDG